MAEHNAATLQKVLEGQNKLFEGLQQLHQKLDSVASQFQSETDALKKENENLKKNLQEVASCLDKQEQHSRSKNIIIYDVPGPAGESRTETEAKVAKITEALKANHRVVVAHRLSPNPNSPIVAAFESKIHAQEMLSIIRQGTLTAETIGLPSQDSTRGKPKKIIARPHLCPALAQLLKMATALKVEANWGWTKVISSKMEIQIFKGRDSDGYVLPPVTVRSPEDVLRLRLQMVEQGRLPELTPAAPAEKYLMKKRPWTDTGPNSGTTRKEKRIL